MAETRKIGWFQLILNNAPRAWREASAWALAWSNFVIQGKVHALACMLRYDQGQVIVRFDRWLEEKRACGI